MSNMSSMSSVTDVGGRLASAPVALRRGTMPAPTPPGAPLVAFRAPLLLKLLGADLLLAAAVAGVLVAAPLRQWPMEVGAAVIAGALVVSFGLVLLALRPLRGIEAVVRRVWRGDFGARVGASAVADRDVARIGTMFNLLLDGLVSDRARMRLLATAVIDAGERERAVLARELHESTAQQLAAIVLQLSAAAHDAREPAAAERLQDIREAAGKVLEEVRLLSQTVHSRVLDDLGLPAALRHLAREATTGRGVEVDVVATGAHGALPLTTATVLYRVAEAAVHNTVRHADAGRLHLALSVGDADATLAVDDDGCGFDVAEAERRRPGMGLFTMRERVGLMGGRFEVHSTPGAGTRITVVVPLSDVPCAPNSLGEEVAHA